METISYDLYSHMQSRVYSRDLPCGATLIIKKLRTGYTVYALMTFSSPVTGEVSEIKVIDSWISSAEGVPLWKEFMERTHGIINVREYPASTNYCDWERD